MEEQAYLDLKRGERGAILSIVAYICLSILKLTVGIFSGSEALKADGFLLIGATNQPDVARGATPQAIVEAINAKLMATLKLDEIRVCYHDDHDQCQCRKPLPGLLIEASKEHDIDLKQSVMIGDRWKDVEAGKNAGCKTIWLRAGYQEQDPPRPPDFIATSLLEAAQWIRSGDIIS